MSVRKYTLRVTLTAIFTALLVTIQFLTAPLGNQLVTGTAVNLLLIISLLTCGPAVGLTVAAISPIFAFLAGMGPAIPPIIPFMMIGNTALIGAWYLLGLLNRQGKPKIVQTGVHILIAIGAAIVKFSVLYIGIVLWAVPYLLSVSQKQSALLTAAFSYPQLLTAIIGGFCALAIAPLVHKALKHQIV